MSKRSKKISQWQKKENFLEYKMGIKGGQGRSNQSIYNDTFNSALGCGLIIFLGFMLMFFGAIYETLRG